MVRESGKGRIDWGLAARQIVRAMRGGRSQVAFSRRAGYRSNVAADWEGGHRVPDADEILRIAGRLGVDVSGAFARFHPASARAFDLADPGALAGWLRALQGSATQKDLADRAGLSRHQVGRWLTGKARPRLHELLGLLDAITGRAADWVAELVDLQQVPALLGVWERSRAARRLVYDVPWAAAVLATLESRDYVALERHDDGWLARRLGVGEEVIGEAVGRLIASGLVGWSGRRLRIAGQLTADVSASRADLLRLKHHWAGVGRERTIEDRPGDLAGFNVFACSRADMDRIRELHRAYFRELRSIVAASEPSEVTGLVLMQVIAWDGADAVTEER